MELRPGRFIAVLGAPGSGKSTMLQHLNGLLLPDEGTVDVFEFRLQSQSLAGSGKGAGGSPGSEAGGGAGGGARAGASAGKRRLFGRRKRAKDPAVPAGLRKRVGLVFQFPEQQLFEETVRRDLMFGPLNFGLGEAEAAAAADKAAQELGLDEELLEQGPFDLSGGQMRKAAIAAVLAAEPDVLALDEPASSLDQASREELMQLLRDWCDRRGKTIVIVTHRLEEVLPYADEYVVIDRGRNEYQGDAATLLRRPEIMAKAGVLAPASARLLAGAAERAGAGIVPPASYLDPDSAAAWIMQLLAAGREGADSATVSAEGEVCRTSRTLVNS
ncbi:ATP-binding cassette domain-containing protein [Cohnella lubricantis]